MDRPKTPSISISDDPSEHAALLEHALSGQGEMLAEARHAHALGAREGGVGLGLTICRGIVEAHGGRIWAENRSGGGALFRFSIPLPAQQPSVETDGPEAGEA